MHFTQQNIKTIVGWGVFLDAVIGTFVCSFLAVFYSVYYLFVPFIILIPLFWLDSKFSNSNQTVASKEARK